MEAAGPYRQAESNRVLWGRAHQALERRGRGNGVAASVRDIFRDESIEREVVQAIQDLDSNNAG